MLAPCRLAVSFVRCIPSTTMPVILPLDAFDFRVSAWRILLKLMSAFCRVTDEFLEGVLVANDDAQPTANEEIASSTKKRRRQTK
jgi:hypothetical protein